MIKDRLYTIVIDQLAIMDVSSPIHARRTALGLSLAGLSERSGVSKAMLSDIERGAKSPTIKTLSHVASGLGCSVSDLLDETGAERSELLSPDTCPSVHDQESGAIRRLLSTGLLHHGIELVRYDLPARAQIGPFPSNGPAVLELVVLLSGRVVVTIDDAPVEMRDGDSLTYQIGRDLVLENPSQTKAQLIILIDRSHVSRPMATRLSRSNGDR